MYRICKDGHCWRDTTSFVLPQQSGWCIGSSQFVLTPDEYFSSDSTFLQIWWRWYPKHEWDSSSDDESLLHTLRWHGPYGPVEMISKKLAEFSETQRACMDTYLDVLCSAQAEDTFWVHHHSSDEWSTLADVGGFIPVQGNILNFGSIGDGFWQKMQGIWINLWWG